MLTRVQAILVSRGVVSWVQEDRKGLRPMVSSWSGPPKYKPDPVWKERTSWLIM